MAGVIDLFPPHTAQDTDGMLVVGGCRLDDVAREYGTPVLVVAEGAVRHRAREYREGLAYNGARRIPVVFADGGRARLVVRRETWDELLSRDVAGPC